MLKYVFALICLLFAQSAKGEQITPKYINDVFERVAKETKVPEKLLRAICFAESKFNPEAYNHGDGKGTNSAFGICQVLHSTARNYGFKDDNCYKSFEDVVTSQGKFIKASRTYKDCNLFGVYTNVTYAAKYLNEQLNRYNNSWISAIAAYNAGTLKVCKTGKVLRAKDRSVLWTCKKGGILNQHYVDDVLQALQENP